MGWSCLNCSSLRAHLQALEKAAMLKQHRGSLEAHKMIGTPSEYLRMLRCTLVVVDDNCYSFRIVSVTSGSGSLVIVQSSCQEICVTFLVLARFSTLRLKIAGLFSSL